MQSQTHASLRLREFLARMAFGFQLGLKSVSGERRGVAWHPLKLIAANERPVDSPGPGPRTVPGQT